MYSLIALIDSNSAGSVNIASVITNMLNVFVTGSSGSTSNGGGIFH
ncbi:hypothetical protein [Nocardia sp. NPDC051570]